MRSTHVGRLSLAAAAVAAAATLTSCAASSRAMHVDGASSVRGDAWHAAPGATLDLAALLRDGAIRAHTRTATIAQDGERVALRLDERADSEVVWLPGASFEEGVIEADIRGRDAMQKSFVGLAFGGDDREYEAVYLRPFLFRATDPAARASALQYMALPAYDWKRLREAYPGRFERALPDAPAPTDWVHLRVVFDWAHVEAFVDGAETPVLDVERIAGRTRGRVGLWIGDGSDGAFANVRVTRLR